MACFQYTSCEVNDVVRSSDIDPNYFAVVKKLRAGRCRIPNERLCQSFKIDDANRWDENATKRVNGSNAPDAAGCHYKFKWNGLPPALTPKSPERIRFAPQTCANAAVRNRNKHARSQQFDAALPGISDHQLAAFVGKPGFERAGNFVESGMDDSTVEP